MTSKSTPKLHILGTLQNYHRKNISQQHPRDKPQESFLPTNLQKFTRIRSLNRYDFLFPKALVGYNHTGTSRQHS